MMTKCEIDGCTNNAQSKKTTSGYELCQEHFQQWSEQNMFIVEDDGKVLLKG